MVTSVRLRYQWTGRGALRKLTSIVFMSIAIRTTFLYSPNERCRDDDWRWWWLVTGSTGSVVGFCVQNVDIWFRLILKLQVKRGSPLDSSGVEVSSSSGLLFVVAFKMINMSSGKKLMETFSTPQHLYFNQKPSRVELVIVKTPT